MFCGASYHSVAVSVGLEEEVDAWYPLVVNEGEIVQLSTIDDIFLQVSGRGDPRGDSVSARVDGIGTGVGSVEIGRGINVEISGVADELAAIAVAELKRRTTRHSDGSWAEK